MKFHLLAKEELKLCSDILGEIITFLHSKKLDNEDNVERDIFVLVDVVMQPLMQTLMTLEREILSTVTVRSQLIQGISRQSVISNSALTEGRM